MARFAAIVLFLLVAPSALAQEVIHYWAFNDEPANPWPTPIMADVGPGAIWHSFDVATLQDFGGSILNAYDNAPAGGSFAIQVGPDLQNNGSSFYVDASTSGFEGIVVSYASRGTGTGFTTHEIAYSVDGEGFIPFQTITGRTGTTFSIQSVDLQAVDEADDNPNFRIRITLSGGTGASGNNRFDNIRVSGTTTGANRPPFFTAVLADQEVSVGELFAFTYDAIDPDGDEVSYSLVEGPADATLSADQGRFEWTPSESEAGLAFDVVVEVSDGLLTSQTSATLIVDGRPGDIPGIQFVSTLPDTLVDPSHTFSHQYAAEGSEGGGVVRYRLLKAPPEASLDEASGLFSWTAHATGVHGVIVSARDDRDSVVVTAGNLINRISRRSLRLHPACAGDVVQSWSGLTSSSSPDKIEATYLIALRHHMLHGLR